MAGKVAGYLYSEILRQELAWTVPKTCFIQPPATAATALRPDVSLLDEIALQAEPLWQREPIITSGAAIRLVVEVVSTHWQDDYARKVEEYALLGVPEYWIVDCVGLRGDRVYWQAQAADDYNLSIKWRGVRSHPISPCRPDRLTRLSRFTTIFSQSDVIGSPLAIALRWGQHFYRHIHRVIVTSAAARHIHSTHFNGAIWGEAFEAVFRHLQRRSTVGAGGLSIL